ncbi:TonB-dependent receptor plug domain-containing protein [Roseomonas haemaphysalidis]|uniref:TonB-dependent receptor n=1 Tax=Roseomonas haemaphysalidis TaxID=2768162 RepID=A0ABS3KLE7_9PROT|nr:TonB-dependent receptor [Roseomonas haemaphysalidis]MBO1078293.1 TonB-dependent receptor [Roseomonas haemaphysalidis]
MAGTSPLSLAPAAVLMTAAMAAMGPAPRALAEDFDRGALEALFGEPVTTSATGKPQRASDVPAAMDIITAEQIVRSGARDIPEVLARYTALDVQQYNVADYNVTARGYAAPNTPRMLVLVNGRQVYRDDYGRVSWQNIPVQLSEIRQIEVVRGPNSALFGFNAGAGVINIITFDAVRDRINNVVLRAGQGRYQEVSGIISAPLGAASGLRLSTGLRDQRAWRSGYSSLDDLLDSDRATRHGQFAGEVAFGVAEGVRASIDASYSRSIDSELQLPGIFIPWDLESWSLRGRVTADTRAGIVEASIYHNALDAKLASVPTNQQGVTVVQLSNTVKLNAAHTLRPFLEYRHNEITGAGSSGILAVPSTRTSVDVAAGGVMWNWVLRPGLEWTAATRYDHLWYGASGYDQLAASPYDDDDFRRSWETLSWNLGLVWKATEADTIRAGAARGVVTPSDYDLSAISPVPLLGLSVLGNPRLKPTTVDNYEIEYRRRVEAINGRFGVIGFFQVNRGINTSLGALPTYSPATGTALLSPYSIGSSHAHGLELSLRGEWQAGFDWGAEYRLAMVEEADAPSYAAFSRASPRHLLSTRLGWGQDALRADIFARYSTEMRGYRIMESGILPVSVGDYVSVSSRVGYKINQQLTVAVEGSSLLHQRQRQSIGAEAERRLFVSLRMDF